MNLKNLKTGVKLNLSFGIVLVLLIIVSISAYFGLGHFERYTFVGQHFNWSESFFINARLNKRTVVHLKQERDYQLAKQNIDSSLFYLNQAGKSIDQLEYSAKVNAVATNLKNYEKSLENLFSLINQEVRVANANITLGENLERQIIRQEQAGEGLQANLLTARLEFLLFQRYQNPVHVENAKRQINFLISQDNFEISNMAREYSNNLSAYADVISQIARETEENQRILGRDIQDDLAGFSYAISSRLMVIRRIISSIIITFTLLSILLSVIVSRLVTQYLTNGIKQGVGLAELYAQGDLTIVVPEAELKKKDELGDLARAMVGMGDRIKEIISDVLTGSGNVALGSEQMSDVSQQLSQGSAEQASSTEEISSSMEQMAANIDQNAHNAQEAESIAIKTDEGITKVADMARESVDAVKEVSEKISIITDIAFQTNILALNAAVEAARAGEHGRGFAVVAAEVRKLAERSRVASDEIEKLSQSSVQLTGGAGDLLISLMPDLQRNTQLVREIAAASLEQRSGADQINNAIQQLNQVVQSNAASSEEMATSAEELSSQAEQLREVISYFKVDAQVQNKSTFKRQEKKAPVEQPKVTTPKPAPKKTSGGISINLQDSGNDSNFEHF